MKCKCPSKQCFFLGLAIAVLYFGMDMFFHHYCMGKIYADNPQYFRTIDQMMANRSVAYLGYLVFGFLFVCIYKKGYEEGKSGLGQGFRYGLVIGLLYWGASMLLSYPFMPWPDRLYLGWFVVGLFETVVLGTILGALFKPKVAS